MLLPLLPLAGRDLGIDGSRFTIDGTPTFLLGLSYYGGLGASEEFIKGDTALPSVRPNKHALNFRAGFTDRSKGTAAQDGTPLFRDHKITPGAQKFVHIDTIDRTARITLRNFSVQFANEAPRFRVGWTDRCDRHLVCLTIATPTVGKAPNRCSGASGS